MKNARHHSRENGLRIENADLRARLKKAEKALRTMASGEKRIRHFHSTPVRREENSRRLVVRNAIDITDRERSEKATERLVAIVESSHDAVFGNDLDGVITGWNAGAEEIFGYGTGEIVGTSIMRLIPAARRAEADELQRRVAAGERVQTLEMILQRKGGLAFPASVTLSPIKDATGKVIGVGRVVRDISQRKRLEDSLQQNASLFSTLIAQAPMGTYVVDAQFRMLQINAEAMPAFASVRPLIGRDFNEILEILWGPVMGAQLASIFRHTLETGEPYVAPAFTERRHDLGIDQSYEWETQRVALPDGRYGVVCYFHEVTQRAQALRALQKSRQRMQLAAEATGVGIWEWNLVTNEIHWDAQMFRLYGIPPTADGIVRYSDWSGAVLPEELAKNEIALQETVRRKGKSSRSFRIRRRDDAACRHIQSVEIVRLNSHGEAAAVLGTNLDVTERTLADEEIRELNLSLERRVRERTRQLEIANIDLEAFNYSIAHDLRTPLRGIAGFGEMLLHDYGATLDANGKEYLRRILGGCEWMSRLIDDLLTFSQVSRSPLQRERVDFTLLAKHMVDDLKRRHPNRAVTVTIAEGLSVVGDAALLQAALQNLIENAWKFTSRTNAACIVLSAKKAETGSPAKQDGPTFFIQDNGVGFDMQYLPRLFHVFQRLHRQEDFPGTGVGLASVQRIIHRHGGRIWAEGAVNQGATFYFTVPSTPPPT